MQLTLVYGPSQARPFFRFLRSAPMLMMADPLSLIEPLDKKGMLRGMAIPSDTLRAAAHRLGTRTNGAALGEHYRAEKKSLYVVARILQAS